jgi:MFS transporter, DHA1 family, tetracycline resistance protein
VHREGLTIVSSAFKKSSNRSAYMTQLLSQFAFVIFEVLFAWILQKQYHFDLKETFYFFGAQGVLLALIQGGLYRRLEKKRPPEHWVRLGLIGSCLGMLLLPWAGYVDGILMTGVSVKICLLSGVLLLMALASGFGGPSLNAYASINAPKNEQGQTMGNMQSLAALARFTAPVVATGLYAVWLPIPFLLGGVLCLMAWAIFAQQRRA